MLSLQKYQNKALLFAFVCVTLLLQGCAAVVIGTAAVASSALVIHDRRSTGTFIDDNSIEFKAERRLNDENEPTAGSNLTVISYNHVVLIVGQVSDEQSRQRATEIVKGVPKVRKVHNQVRISGHTTYLARTNDAYITSKIKSLFLVTKGIDATRIKVVTDSGVVYLLGLVTKDEGKIATDIARNTGGVQQVVQVVEPYQPKLG